LVQRKSIISINIKIKYILKMNRQEIINKIREIFGSVNTEEKFGVYKTEEGVEFRIEDLALEKDVYILTPEGELPAPMGDIVLEDGTKVKIGEDGKVKEIQIVEEEEVVEEETMEDHEDKEDDEIKMAEAKLIDGTMVETDGDLEVGVELYVKTEEGRQPAPTGEHETEDGMVVVVEDGKIVEIKEKEVEEVKEEEEIKVEEMMETFMDALETISNELSNLRKENEELNNKFSKFAAEPAGEKIYDRKGAYVEQLMSAKVDKLERLAALRRGK
jgi:hypothetical protein